MPEVQLTWLGHGTFRFDYAGREADLRRPLAHEPEVPREREGAGADRRDRDHARPRRPRRQHRSTCSRSIDCTVVAPVELADWLVWMKKAVAEDKIRDPNKGGTVDVDGVKVTLTHAQHSSGTIDDDHMVVPRRARRLRVRGRERHEDLLRRRHERLRRHAADQAAVRAGRRGAADRRPLHDGPDARRLSHSSSSARRSASRATTARSRSSPGRPTSCASWRRRASRSSRCSRERRSSV